jgi:hypothetical protein
VPTENEMVHVKQLESVIDNRINNVRIKYIKILLNYYISRNNFMKVNYYLNLFALALDEYAGDLYVTDVDMLKLYQAEYNIMNNDSAKAKELINSVAKNFCKYQTKNYLRMHLNQVASKAGIRDACLID